jgi:hypothetical protein
MSGRASYRRYMRPTYVVEHLSQLLNQQYGLAGDYLSLCGTNGDRRVEHAHHLVIHVHSVVNASGCSPDAKDRMCRPCPDVTARRPYGA